MSGGPPIPRVQRVGCVELARHRPRFRPITSTPGDHMVVHKFARRSLTAETLGRLDAPGDTALPFTRSLAKEQLRLLQVLTERHALSFGIGPHWPGHACLVLIEKIQADLSLFADLFRQDPRTHVIEGSVSGMLSGHGHTPHAHQAVQPVKLATQFLSDLARVGHCRFPKRHDYKRKRLRPDTPWVERPSSPLRPSEKTLLINNKRHKVPRRVLGHRSMHR